MNSGASKIGASALNFEPENCIMSEQIYSDIARKTGKTTQTWRAFPANGSDMARKSGSPGPQRSTMGATSFSPKENPAHPKGHTGCSYLAVMKLLSAS
jgi:hypothetical protein